MGGRVSSSHSWIVARSRSTPGSSRTMAIFSDALALQPHCDVTDHCVQTCLLLVTAMANEVSVTCSIKWYAPQFALVQEAAILMT